MNKMKFILIVLLLHGINATFVFAADNKNCTPRLFIKQQTAPDEIAFLPPSPKNLTEAERLKAEGFDADYYRGIDQVYNWILLRKYMRNHLLSADSKKLSEAHSDFFGEEIKAHIEYMENQAKTERQRNNLKLLKAYSEDKIRERKFSYRELLKCSILLAGVFSEDEPISLNLLPPADTAVINEIIDEFPYKVLMPSTAGEAGFIALNRAAGENIHIGGLVAEYKFVDVSPEQFAMAEMMGVEPPEKSSPWVFFIHDVGHMIRSGRVSKSIHNEVLKTAENLSVEHRKIVEKAYFDALHEDSEDIVPESLGALMTPVLTELSGAEVSPDDEQVRDRYSFSVSGENPKKIAEDFVKWALSEWNVRKPL